MEMHNPPHPGDSSGRLLEAARSDRNGSRAGAWHITRFFVGAAERAQRHFCRNGNPAGKGWMEHGGDVAADAAYLRSLARETKRRTDQGCQVSDA